MIRLPPVVRISLIACVLTASSAPATLAQSRPDPSPGFLEGLFGGDQAQRQDKVAQASQNELSVRIDRLEAQIRQMTGVIEELQFRNRELADQLRRLQGDTSAGAPSMAQAAPPQQPPSVPPRTAPTASPAVASGTRPVAPPPPAGGNPGGRRSDAFDPAQNPNAPGVPRPLGTVPAGTGGDQVAVEEQPAPPGRAVGEPLNLSNASANAGGDAGNPPSGGGDGRSATLPPSDSPKDYYDLAYGYVLRKDYPLAEDAFRNFLRKFPSDRMAPEAEFYLGESLFQRQRYRDAAEAFLNVSTKYESAPKAPDSLLRLGQSLAFLGEKEAACASLGEVLRKYPRAALAVKQGVDREQKRDGC
jgi:tol-pal system protein YbgF